MYQWLLNFITILYFTTFVLAQDNVESQYLSNDEYWYSTGITKKTYGSDYRMEARNIALSDIARQISSTISGIETRITSEETIKNKDYGIAQEVFSSTISNEINAIIEYDIEDIEKKMYGKSYHHVMRLSKDKYFVNRNIKRNNAINKSVSILNNLDIYPTKASINNLNDIVITLIPYADENLNYTLNDGQTINLLGHAVSLARNYMDRIVVDYTIIKYPLKSIDREFEFIIRVFDSKSEKPINNLHLIDLKSNRMLKNGDKDFYNVKGKVSRKNSFNYELNLKASFPNFIIFDLDNKFYSFNDQYFKNQKPPSITLFNLDNNYHSVPRFGFELITKKITKGFNKDFEASVYQIVGLNSEADYNKLKIHPMGHSLEQVDNTADFAISTQIVYDDFNKNQYGRYVCYVSAEFNFSTSNEIYSGSYTVSDIRGISALSKNDAIRDALETINKDYGNKIYKEFKNALLNN